jgi:hypothetical protein
MKKAVIKLALTTVLIALIATSNVLGVDLSARNYKELENVLIEQMSKYNQDFEIIYTGSLDNIEDIITKALSKDTYINSNVKSISWKITGTKISSTINVEVNYIITSAKRSAADKQIDNILSEIIKPTMNDHEKVKAVHDYIVLNSKYDRSQQFYSDYDLLTHGTSVCNGYALLTYNMLNKLNIPVRLVTGTANSELHIWNMVKLGDYWFHLDTTWNDPLPDTDMVSYNYYMLTDKEIEKDHTIDSSLDLPIASKVYYDYLKELSYDRLLMEIGLDIYDDVNTAENEQELKKILEFKIKHRPKRIAVRISKNISQDSINNAMSNLLAMNYISEIGYGQLVSDKTEKYYILNLYIKYKDAPDSIVLDFSNKVYNTATKINYNVYAQYGSKKININDSVLIYPYDRDGMSIANGTITFKKPGNYYVQFEYQGIRETAKITALNAEAFQYITDKKPSNPVNIKVYDQYIDFSKINQWPVIESGRTMVPIRAVFEVMNCKVRWEPSRSSAIVEYDGTTIVIPVNSEIAYINGKASKLDAPAKLVNDRIMVPLRFISEAINKIVIWDDADKTVLIY